MKRYVLYLVLVMFATELAVAADLSRLNSLVSRGSLDDIAKSLSSESGKQWPEIVSTQVDNHRFKKQVASLLLSKILQTSATDPKSSVPVLASLAEILNASGGYCNFVIADTATRLAVASLIDALVTGTLTPEEAKQLLALLPDAFLATDEWIKLLNQEMALGNKADILRTTKSEDYLNQMYVLTETSAEAVYVKIGENQITSEILLKERNIAVLARRMAETEAYRIAHLGALIFFLENGGKLQEIDLNDVREVNNLFSQGPTFAAPLLQIRQINAMHLKLLVGDEYSSDNRPRILLGYE